MAWHYIYQVSRHVLINVVTSYIELRLFRDTTHSGWRTLVDQYRWSVGNFALFTLSLRSDPIFQSSYYRNLNKNISRLQWLLLATGNQAKFNNRPTVKVICITCVRACLLKRVQLLLSWCGLACKDMIRIPVLGFHSTGHFNLLSKPLPFRCRCSRTQKVINYSRLIDMIKKQCRTRIGVINSGFWPWIEIAQLL